MKSLPGARFITALFLTMLGGFAGHAQTGGQVSFENNSSNGWLGGGSTETVAPTTAAARTGAYSLALVTTSASGNKFWYSNTPFVTTGSGTYAHFIYWAKGSDNLNTMDASMRYGTGTPPPVGIGSSANGTTTATLNTTTWTRLSFNAGNSTRFYFPAPRRTNGPATTIYIDDVLMYLSSSTTTDLTDPGTPTALTATAAGSNVNLSWTSALDAGTGATGVQNTIVLRTANTSATAPDLNDQATYSTAGGATGPNTAGSWTIISTTTGATATSYTDASVATGTYKYAVILRDGAYNYSLAAVSPAVSVGTAPAITTAFTGFTSAFGNTVAGTSSAEQTYSVSGSDLTADITVTAPAGFEVSTTTGTGFGTSLTLSQTAGAVAATTIYVRYSPTAATGATGSLSITNASAGATTQTIPVSGNALAVEPTLAGTITTGAISNTSIELNLPTVGDGTRRLIVGRDGSAVSFGPADGLTMAGVSADFSLAADQGSGNKVVYDGTGSGSSVVTVTGLTMNDTYYFTVYEYNVGTGTSQNYLLSPAASTAPAVALPVVLTGFSARWAGGQTAVVNWATASESKMARYVIERSYNGSDFEDAGDVMPRGAAFAYQWTDETKTAAGRYYRLRMEEWNGSASYSATQKLNGSNGQVGTIAAGPAPFAQSLTLRIQSSVGGDATVVMTDALGRIVRSQALALRAGENVIAWTDMGALAAGTYYLGVSGGDQAGHLQIVKQ